MRNKLGFQTSNVGFDINTQLRCKGDYCVVMQYGDDVVPRILEVNPNMFFTFRWYTRNTVKEDPCVIADQARGWADGLKQRNPTLSDEQFCIQLSNEANLQVEYDDPGVYDSEEWYRRIGNWEYSAISALKSQRPNYKCCAFNLSPGHSEDQDDNGYIAYSLPEMQRAASVADFIGGHFYWQNAGRGAIGLDDGQSDFYFQRFKKVHTWFPNLPIIINESNGDDIHLLPQEQRVIATQELAKAIDIVNQYDYVVGCNFFIWFSQGHPSMYCDEVMNYFESIELPKYEYGSVIVTPDYPTAKWIGSPHYDEGREDNIYAVVIHSMEGTLAGCDAWFNSNDPKAGASHYGIGVNGEVHQYVLERNAAWHVSEGGWNQCSIGIELEGHAGDKFDNNTAQWKALIELSKYLLNEHELAIDDFMAHSVLQKDRSDPGAGFNWDKFNAEVNMTEISGPDWIMNLTPQQRIDKIVELTNTNAHLVKILNDIRTMIDATI